MGWKNANRALVADVSPLLARHLFVVMALTASDKDDPPRYFGSVDWLVNISGSDRRYVRRILRGMEKDGWITPDGYVDGKRAWILRLPGGE